MHAHDAVKRLLIFAVSLVLLCNISGCGGKGSQAVLSTTPQANQQGALGESAPEVDDQAEFSREIALAEIIAEIEECTLSTMIEASLQSELKQALIEVLGASGLDRVTSTPPAGDPNRITDAYLTRETSGNYTLSWSFINLGDYDQNGEVNISDLTPLGLNFGLTGLFAYNTALSVVDGDGNGEINIADVTPIGQHFRYTVVHYAVYASADQADYPATADAPNGAGARLLGTVAFSSATGSPATDRLRFTFTISDPVDGEYYWVRPSDGTTEGAPSALLNPTGRGDWWMFGREPQQNALSPYVGPWSQDLRWTYTTGDSVCSSAAIRADGGVYIGCNDGNLYAINADGTLAWTFPAGGDMFGGPAIGIDGAVYVGSATSNLYAINPDGTEAWTFPAGGSIFGSPSIGADGTIYVGCFDNNLYAVNPDGTELWHYEATASIQSCPAIGPDDTIYVSDLMGVVHAVSPGGTAAWTFPTGIQITASAAIGADGTLYVGNQDGNLFALTPSGSELWRYDCEGNVRCSAAIGADGTVYVMGGGWLHAVNPADGTCHWRFDIHSETYSSPAIGADGTIYFSGGYDWFCAVNPDGTLHWSFVAPDDIDVSSPAIRADGTVIVGGDNGDVYAFGGGIGTAAGIDRIRPQDGISGTPATFRVEPIGTPPITYSWDFGGGAAPNTSTTMKPAVTLGEPGVYEGSVTVSNSYGDPATETFTFAVVPVEGQSGGWVHSWGNTSDEIGYSIAADASGNLFVAGPSADYVNETVSVLLLKYAPDGTLLFAKTWSSSENDLVYSIAVDGTGDVYLAGATRGAIIGDSDTLLLRYSNAGELLWAKSWDGGDEDAVHALALHPGGDILMVGETQSTGGGTSGALFISYDETGVLDHSAAWDTDGEESLHSIAVDEVANIYFAGLTNNYSSGDMDLVLFRLNPDVSVDWLRVFSTPGEEWMSAISMDSTGNAYVVCSTATLVMYNATGDLQWARSWADEDGSLAGSISVSGDEIVIAGCYTGDEPDWLVLGGGLTGEATWGWRFRNGSVNEVCLDVAHRADGGVYLAGFGFNSFGLWESHAVTTTEVTGTSSTPAETGGDIAGTASDIVGTDEFVTGTEDTGGGGQDVMVMSWDFSAL